MKIKNIIFIIVVVLVGFFGCGKTIDTRGAKQAGASYGVVRVKYSSDRIQTMILREFRQWEGTPHKMGGNSKRGVDCSGFVHHIYTKLFHMDVPRSTQLFMEAGVEIKKSNLKPGDLVVFTPHSYPRHVGIYVGNNGFVHASSSKGVMMSDLKNRYWKKHYKMSRRLLISE